MGFWLMPLPETYLNGTVTVPRYQDFQALIDEVSYLEDSFLIGMPQFGTPAGGSLFAPPPPELMQLMQGGWPTVEQLENYLRSANKPAWSVTLQFYGPEETVRANWAAAKRRFAKAIPGAAFEDGIFIPLPVPPEAEAEPRAAHQDRARHSVARDLLHYHPQPDDRQRSVGRSRGLLCHGAADGQGGA